MIISQRRQIQDQLIPAKISLPHQRTGIVHRKHAFKWLEKCFSHRLTLVSAPAGYGKTTLVSDWLSLQKIPAAWLSLTEEDNQVPTFLSYLAATLLQTNPAVGKAIEDAFFQDQPIDTHALMIALMQQMDQVTPAMVLVLDDYHLIRNPEIHEMVQFMLQNCIGWRNPEICKTRGCHLILVSRCDPPFPIAKWRIDEEIVEIRTNELKFTLDETETFLKGAYKSGLQPERIERIAETTEGWVTGLQLLVLALNSSRAETAEINASNRYLVDYLMEEVIQNLPEDIQHFLLLTSLLDHLTGDLCDQICEQTGSQQTLEWLVRENLFTLPMDSKQGWYRYHQLFRNVLVQRQYRLRKEEIQRCQNLAARWLESKGYYQESLRHWLGAGNIAEAARMMIVAAPELLNTSQVLTLRELCDAFPESAFAQYPWLLIYRTWSNTIVREESLTSWLDQALEMTNAEKDRNNYPLSEIMEMQGNIHAIRALHEARYGEDEKTITLANQALELLPPRAINVKGLVLIAIAKIHYRNGELDQAVDLFMQAKNILQDGGNLAGLVEALYITGRIYMIKGKLKTAYQVFGDAISILTTYPGNHFYYSYLSYSARGLIELEWNHRDQAEEDLRKGFEIRRVMGITDMTASSIAQVEGYIHCNQIDEAGQIIHEIELFLNHPMLGDDGKTELLGFLLRYYALHHDYQIARQLIAENHIETAVPGDFRRESEVIGLAYFYWQARDWDALDGLMERLIPALEQSGRTGRLILIQTLYSAALFQMGELRRADDYLSSALINGLRDGYFGTYVSFGEAILQLIFALANNDDLEKPDGISPLFLQDITNAISKRIIERKYFHSRPAFRKPNHPGHPEILTDPLTAQENLVLRYLAAGNDYQTIAKELSVSKNTIKTHVSSIYGKLEVHRRIEAVYRAKELGLL